MDRVIGKVPQVAIFDTGFHSTIEPSRLCLCRALMSGSNKASGAMDFTGSACNTRRGAARNCSADRAGALRLIVCHLGNGASVTAVAAGKSIDNSMGFTPLEGLMMGTRCGSIDPGIVIHLLRHFGYTADQLDDMLNKESGLLGVSGLSGDMREILEAIESGNDRARLAYQSTRIGWCAKPAAMLGGSGRCGRDRFHRRHRRELRSAPRRMCASILVFWDSSWTRPKNAAAAARSKHRSRRFSGSSAGDSRRGRLGNRSRMLPARDALSNSTRPIQTQPGRA